MDIQKIVIHKDSAITIEYNNIVTALEGDDPIYERITFKSNRDAQRDFYTALADLRVFAIDMLEIYDREISRVQVKGASFKRTKEGIMGVVLLIEISMDHALTPLRIDTPHYIAESYSEDGDEENILHEDCIPLLTKLKKKAVDYVNGVTDQEELPLEE